MINSQLLHLTYICAFAEGELRASKGPCHGFWLSPQSHLGGLLGNASSSLKPHSQVQIVMKTLSHISLGQENPPLQ